MSTHHRLRVSRRSALALSAAALGVLPERLAAAAEGPPGRPSETQILALFSGTPQDVFLETSEREGGDPPKYVELVAEGIGGKKKAHAWHWDSPLRNGEAQMERATLLLGEDGSARFSAILHSKRPDDHWNVLVGVRSKSRPKQSLFTLPRQSDKPRLSPEGNVTFRWLQFPAPKRPLKIEYQFPVFDASMYADVGEIVLACDC